MSADPQVSLYESRLKIQPRAAHGRYARLRNVAVLALLGLYYVLPWLSWNGTPLVWLDLPHRQFHVFGLTLAPQDLILLTLLLLTAALTLFFFTTLAGRIWCGYACPQTVWTEAFLWIEQRIEGDRHARIKLDRAPWGPRKLLRRGGRHLAWIAFALFTGLTFVAYFVPARELFPAALHLQLGGAALFWSLFYAFATWGNAGFMREQVCKYMCPYARFQSAMFDRDTLIVAYDEPRGEPRKSKAREVGLAAGDCTDCTLCVQVCPTGIDIRKGLQYECIACAACVDVCNDVMDSIGKPRGLIRYTSSRQEAGGSFRLLRPRIIGYGIVWLLACAALTSVVLMRTPMEFDVMRDRHTLYRHLDDGRTENVYTLKLSNKDRAAHRFDIAVTDDSGAPLEVVPASVELAASEHRAIVVSVRRAPLAATGASSELHFSVQAADAPKLRRVRESRFIDGN